MRLSVGRLLLLLLGLIFCNDLFGHAIGDGSTRMPKARIKTVNTDTANRSSEQAYAIVNLIHVDVCDASRSVFGCLV